MTNAQEAGGRFHVWTKGDRLRAARENMPGSPTQAQFASILGVGRNTIVRYEGDDPGATKPIVFIRWAQVTGYNQIWRTATANPMEAYRIPVLITSDTSDTYGSPPPRTSW